MARMARKKVRDCLDELVLGNGWTAETECGLHGTVYHCYNRYVGNRCERPFTDEDQADLVRLLKLATKESTVLLLAWETMGNHFHVMLFVPAEALSPEAAAVFIKQARPGKKMPYPPGSPKRDKLPEDLRDLSVYMRAPLRNFAVAFNKRHRDAKGNPRSGHVFGGRFQSTVVGDHHYFMAALLYVILNPVRAGLCENALASRHGMWGEWNRTGRCPLAPRAVTLLRYHLGLLPDASHATVFKALKRLVELATEAILMKTRPGNFAGGRRGGSPLPEAGAKQEQIDSCLELLAEAGLGLAWLRGGAVGSLEFIEKLAALFSKEKQSQGPAPPAMKSSKDPPRFATLVRMRQGPYTA